MFTTFKQPLAPFLASNPFVSGLTLGFFYREKMRAIHRVAPDKRLADILELGGGRSGLTRLLYPAAQVVNVDPDPSLAEAVCNNLEGVRFLCGDVTALDFADHSFDAVTMFDVLHHIPDDVKARSEAWRVLKPGGYLILSAPNERWRFPYFALFRPWCRSEAEILAEWGSVRRGYSADQLARLIGYPPLHTATFISPLTVMCHDIAFSRLPGRLRRLFCLLLWPITWTAYALHRPDSPGTETAYAWRKPEETK